jgi:preprotein translocase subunit SecG
MVITRKHVFSFIFLAIFSTIQLITFASLAQPVLADNSLFSGQTGINEIGKVYGSQQTDIRVVVANIIQRVLEFLAIIFLVLVLYAGFRYMTAAGNEDQTKKAVTQIRDAVIGLIIVLISWSVTEYIIRWISYAVDNKVTGF